LKNTLRTYIFTIVALVGLNHQSFSQYKILNDSNATTLVQQAIDSIYNLNFDVADSLIGILDNKLGEYPGNLLLKAFYTNWKYKPIKEQHPSYTQFESYLNRSIELCEAMLKDDKDNEEANFFMMASHAFLAELYMNNGHNFKALGEAKSAYKYIKIGFDQLDTNPEFYFSSGIFNYYREKYPEENTFYKPFIWFFRSGDKEEGINMLKKGAELASFTKAECLTYVFHIYLRYEDKPNSSMHYARLLHNKYPNNLHYVANYVENSIRLNQYQHVLPLIQRLLESTDTYYQYLGEIFYGNYLENHTNNPGGALTEYKKADITGNEKDCREMHYDSMLFLGMGRVYQKQGSLDLAKDYLKKSAKSAEYQAYREDALELLNAR
jgi:tetratricopeptide (TPR) repeat protein